MKLVDALNELLSRTEGILQEEAYRPDMLDRLARMKAEIIEPGVRTLRAHGEYNRSAEVVESLYTAVSDYVEGLQYSFLRQCQKRRKVIEQLHGRIRRELLGGDGNAVQAPTSQPGHNWPWATRLDEKGRLVYRAPHGGVFLARSHVTEEIGALVIEHAMKAQMPYPASMRPLDAKGSPGGLIYLHEGQRAIVIGDLHGRYDNLQSILKDKNNLADVLSGRAHLIFTGDAVHPRSSATESEAAYADSFCVMLLIMALKAERPLNVHYVIGNHDNAHVGGAPAGRGQVRQDLKFQKFVNGKFGKSVFARYREFVASSPAAVKVMLPNGALILVHAGLSPLVKDEQGLVNIFGDGRKGRALQDLLWRRNYDKQTIQTCLAGLKATFVISGHTAPSTSRAEHYGFSIMAESVMAHVHDLQIILMAQGDIFGYADLDMTTPLPANVSDMMASDGKPSFRILKPKSAKTGSGALSVKAPDPVLANPVSPAPMPEVCEVEVVEDADLVEAELLEETEPTEIMPPISQKGNRAKNRRFDAP